MPVVLPELLVELVGFLFLEGLLDADPPSYIDKRPEDAARDELGNDGEGYCVGEGVREVWGHLRALKVAWRMKSA